MASKPTDSFGASLSHSVEPDGSLLSLWLEVEDFQEDPSEEKGERSPLSREHYYDIISQFKDNGGQRLGIFSPSDPFHAKNRDLVTDILRQANSSGLHATVFTTGDTIFWETSLSGSYHEIVSDEPDFALLNELLELNVTLLIRCDSLRQDLQDSIIARPGYSIARDSAIELILKQIESVSQSKKLRLGLFTSALTENKNEVAEIHCYAKIKGLEVLHDVVFPPMRQGESGQKYSWASEQEQKYISLSILRRSGTGGDDSGACTGATCNCIRDRLFIDIYGDAHICTGAAKYKRDMALGNVKKESLWQIWAHPICQQLRNCLQDYVFGPCAWCVNFEKSCWVCFGRSVENVQFRNDIILLFTKGCHRHRPDWNSWLLQCDKLIRNRISNVPSDIKKTVRRRIRAESLELFWQALAPEITKQSSQDRPISTKCKDLPLSALDYSVATFWDSIKIPRTQDSDQYLESLRSLLPRILLMSLKLASERCLEEKQTRPYRIHPEEKGSIQFINLMFYLPQRSRYMYRSLAHNSLDPGVLDMDENRDIAFEDAKKYEEAKQKIRLRNRMVRLWFRWPETFREGEDPAILKYFKNFSQTMEDQALNTYELILSRDIYEKNRLSIDSDIQQNHLSVLAVYPIFEKKMSHDRVKDLAERVLSIVQNEKQWKETYSILSECIFAKSWDSEGSKLKVIEDNYKNLASIGFYPIETSLLSSDSRNEMEGQLNEALTEIVCLSLHPFPDTSESEWFSGSLPDCLPANDWRKLLAYLENDYGDIERTGSMLRNVFNASDQADMDVLMARLKNPILLPFLRLFISREGGESVFQSSWPRALNYFIWLAFLKENLDIQTYFVHHVHNMRRHFDVFLENVNFYSTPSGMVICSHDRLPLSAKQQYEKLFTQIMDPLEELVQAEFLSRGIISSELELHKALQVADARRDAMGHYGHTFKNRIQGHLQNLKINGAPDFQVVTADALLKMSIILELGGIDKWADFDVMPKEKQKRFLRYREQGPWNMLNELKERWLPEWLTLRTRDSFSPEMDKAKYIYTVPDAHISITKCNLGFSDTREERLCDDIYRQLFYEIFLNIYRHGHQNLTDKTHKGLPVANISVYIKKDKHDNKNLLAITNYSSMVRGKDGLPMAAKKPGGFEFTNDWTPWPMENKEHSIEDKQTQRTYNGPAMAIDLLKRLGAGELFYKINYNRSGFCFFSVGVHLDGLDIE